MQNLPFLHTWICVYNICTDLDIFFFYWSRVVNRYIFIFPALNTCLRLWNVISSRNSINIVSFLLSFTKLLVSDPNVEKNKLNQNISMICSGWNVWMWLMVIAKLRPYLVTILIALGLNVYEVTPHTASSKLALGATLMLIYKKVYYLHIYQ